MEATFAPLQPIRRTWKHSFLHKTIFFNGSFWNHINGDRHKCDRGYSGGPHDVEVIGHKEIVVGKTFFAGKPIMGKAPVHRCTACKKENVAESFSGYWFPDLGYDCPAKVATPFTLEGGERQ